MKLKTALVALVLVACVGAAWAQDAPSMDIPLYPGGESTMEINMGQADILPMLRTMLPLMSGKTGSLMGQINVDEISAVLKDVTQIEFLQVEVAKSSVKESDVADFYAKKLPEGKWTRVFRQSQSGVTSIFVQSGMTAIYGYRVQTIKVDGKPVKQAQVAKIMGKIDYAKLMEIASKIALANQNATPPSASAKDGSRAMPDPGNTE